jgi:Fur family ferric uptake transcriptional regulator
MVKMYSVGEGWGDDVSGRPANYTTKQGEAVLAYLRAQTGEHVTAARIAAHFAQNGAAIGRTTIYRQLDRLVREGRVQKYVVSETAAACYQYADGAACAGVHYHLKCDQCGELIHTREGVLPDIARDIQDGYAFEIDVNRTVFSGVCGGCAGGGKS